MMHNKLYLNENSFILKNLEVKNYYLTFEDIAYNI